MKMTTIKSKVNLLWLVLPMLLLTANSCILSSKSKENRDELSKEVQDVKNELSEISTQEKKQIKRKTNSLIADFNSQVNAIEKDIEEGNKKLNKEAQEVLDILKAERDTLNMKINEIENQSKENWASFKEELEHDSEQFSNSVEDFFEDNA